MFIWNELFQFVLSYTSHCVELCIDIGQNLECSPSYASSKAQYKNIQFSRILTLTEWDKDAAVNETRNVIEYFCL